MPANPFDQFDSHPAPRGGPVYGAPPKPEKPNEPKTTWRQGVVNGKPVQISSEGKVEALPGDVAKSPIAPADLAAVREEARQKIKLIDSMRRRSKNGWFTTGFGANTLGLMGGTSAYDMQGDIDTIKNAGALAKVMEMSRANGGKNPLTPLSNSDFTALGNSITTIDRGLSDEKFQENLDVMRSLWLRAFKNAGGQTYTGNRNTGKPVGQQAPASNSPAVDAILRKHGVIK